MGLETRIWVSKGGGTEKKEKKEKKKKEKEEKKEKIPLCLKA